MKRFLPAVYALTLVVVSWLSYAFVDPNLTLINRPEFLSWQEMMWALARQPLVLAQWFSLLTAAVGLGYAVLLATWRKKMPAIQTTLLWLVILGAILFAGHNAYSHDIFNYLFNAKMVTQYGVNPHVQVALDFPNDPWIRFMHNVHTPAPYGYGWTLASLVPFALGAGKFLTSYLVIKAFMAVGLALYLWSVWKLLQQEKHQNALWNWSVLAFHPLLLIETLLNGHNDVWMMAPALGAWYFIKQKRRRLSLVLAVILLLLSVSVKYATLVLVPLMIMELLPSKRWSLVDWVKKYWAELSALALVAPLVTARSQQFHPWYLIWSLSFLPLIRWRWLRFGLMGLSVGSLFRYYPWIAAGFQYTDQIQIEMRVITWSGLAVGLALWFLLGLRKRKKR